MLSRTLSRYQSSLSLKQFYGNQRLENRKYCAKPPKDSTEAADDATNDEPKISELLKDAANFNEATDTSWATTPYPEGAPSAMKDEAVKRVKQDPLDSSIILFPGQGTLKVGMVKKYMHFPRVRELFDNANDLLGYDIRKLCLEGPQVKLDRTEFNQPATVVSSLAALERLWEERPRAIESCKAVAGYSIGEITALIFSGALTVDDGIKLAAVRGAAMQTASEITPQGMLYAYCTPVAKISSACKDAEKWAMDMGAEKPVCRIAVYLYTQGKIIAGNEEALRYLEDKGHSLGLRQLKRIPVSGAFHTLLMEPALKPFIKALRDVEIDDPRIKVYSNFNVRVYHSAMTVRKLLPRQMISAVKWEQVLQSIYHRPPGEAFPRTFDLGSSGTLKNILSRINAKASDFCYDL